jgi:hypothetical protein
LQPTRTRSKLVIVEKCCAGLTIYYECLYDNTTRKGLKLKHVAIDIISIPFDEILISTGWKTNYQQQTAHFQQSATDSSLVTPTSLFAKNE